MRTDATTRKHVIERISYALDVLVCSCGSAMTANGTDWKDHRNSVGLVTLSVSQTIGKRTRSAS